MSHVISTCNFLSNHQPVFKTIYIIFTFPQAVMRVVFVSHPCQHLVGSVYFFNWKHFKSMSWYLIVLLICISLMFNDDEHPFMYLLAILYFFMVQCSNLLSIFLKLLFFKLKIENL